MVKQASYLPTSCDRLTAASSMKPFPTANLNQDCERNKKGESSYDCDQQHTLY